MIENSRSPYEHKHDLLRMNMNVSIDFLKTSFSKAILFATKKYYYLADQKQTKFSRICKEADSKKEIANKSIVRKKGNIIINLQKTDLERWSAN